MSILFKTQRLSICPIILKEDFVSLLVLHNHEATMRWIPNNKSIWTFADLEKKYQVNQTQYDQQLGIYKIVGQDQEGTYTIMGEIGLFPCLDHPTHIEVGYILHETYCKKGFATELLRGLEQFIQQHLTYTHIRAQLFEANGNSKKLLERCSFSLIDAVPIDTINTKLIYSKAINRATS